MFTQHHENHFKNNLAVLRKNHYNLWRALTTEKIAPVGTLSYDSPKAMNLEVTTRDGKNVFLHDKIDPLSEIDQFLKIVPPKATGVAILFGGGLGYAARAILKKRKMLKHFVLVELDPGIIIQAMHANDLTDLFADPRLILSVGRAPKTHVFLSPIIRSLRLDNIHTLKHLPSFQLDKEGYEKIHENVFEFVNANNIEGNTISEYGGHFQENRFYNLSAIRHNYLLEKLSGVFKGLPAIIVAGGPSLDKNIDQLKKTQDKAIIICVDTVLPALLKKNITPDFVCSIDYKELIFEKVANMAAKAKDISLICFPWVAPSVPKILPTTNTFWIFSGKPIEAWFNKLLGGNLLTEGAGSVAQLNFLAATIMGCSPIIFVGQDLAYTTKNSHMRHATLTHTENMNKILKSKDLMWVKGVNEEQVPTKRAYYGIKKHFEKLITANPNKYINATEGGAHIEGTEVLSLQKTLAQYCNTEVKIKALLKDRMEDMGKVNVERLTREFKNTLNTLKKINRLIQNGDELHESVLKKISRLQKGQSAHVTKFDRLPAAIQKNILKIENTNNTLDSYQQIWELLQDVTIRALKKSETTKQELTVFEKDSRRYLEWLLKSLNRVHKVNKARKTLVNDFVAKIEKFISHTKKESQLMDIVQHKDSPNHLVELARLYYESNDLNLCQQIVEPLLQEMPNSAELNFYMGVVSARQNAFKEAEIFFQKTVHQRPSYVDKIKNFQWEMGNRYVGFANFFKKLDKNTTKKLLIKGVLYCTEHDTLNNSLLSLLESDLEIFSGSLNSPTFLEHTSTIKLWRNSLIDNQHFHTLTDEQQRAAIHLYWGKILQLNGNLSAAVDSAQQSLREAPLNPDAHLILTDVFFSLNNFTSGLAHLQKAVAIDRNLAVHWELLGDTLAEAEQYQDALYAYEQYFTALPENIGILKKIGDCYLALDKLKAAKETYSQLKNQLAA